MTAGNGYLSQSEPIVLFQRRRHSDQGTGNPLAGRGNHQGHPRHKIPLHPKFQNACCRRLLGDLKTSQKKPLNAQPGRGRRRLYLKGLTQHSHVASPHRYTITIHFSSSGIIIRRVVSVAVLNSLAVACPCLRKCCLTNNRHR